MTNSKEMNMYNENEINNIYGNIKELVINSRNKVYTAVNTEMLNLYWNIGKIIMEIQQGMREHLMERLCLRNYLKS